MRIKKFQIKLFKVIGEGGLSAPGLGEGRFIPILIIDAYDNKEINDLITLHQENIPPGDATFLWGSPLWNPNKIILSVEFMKPMDVSFGIEFDLKTQFSVIDGIIQSRGFFLQIGVIGDKPSSTMKTDKILLEVPDMNFDTKWNELLFETLKSKYKKKHLPKKEVSIAVQTHLKGMRELWKIRRDH
ncbi:MAG TPA: hypothetical protein VGI43_19860 [Mucilaginibacter sp.]|jgi:hypothetical protein